MLITLKLEVDPVVKVKKFRQQLCTISELIYYTYNRFSIAGINNRFFEHAVNLFILSNALSPISDYKLFNIDDICMLVKEFSPQDFTEQEKVLLRF
jgi:hypothetical protein